MDEAGIQKEVVGNIGSAIEALIDKRYEDVVSDLELAISNLKNLEESNDNQKSIWGNILPKKLSI